MSDNILGKLNIYGCEVQSRLMIGTARYPSPKILQDAIAAGNVEIVTVSLRRETAGQNQSERFWEILKQSQVHILPNTAGCMTVKEAVTTAHMARDLFDTSWIKLEVVGDELTLQPDTVALVEAADILIKEGFKVLPYTTEDIVIAERLINVGCQVVMPWGSPIGSGQGIINPRAIKFMRRKFPEVTLVLDAGIGKPSHAAMAMELGCDAVLANTAIALARDPATMAAAFTDAVKAGRLGYVAGCMEQRDIAEASTPNFGLPFRD